MLKFYTGFEINDQTGNALTEKEMTTLHYDRITSLQVNTECREIFLLFWRTKIQINTLFKKIIVKYIVLISYFTVSLFYRS